MSIVRFKAIVLGERLEQPFPAAKRPGQDSCSTLSDELSNRLVSRAGAQQPAHVIQVP